MAISISRRRLLGVLAGGTVAAALIAPAGAFGVVEGGSPTPADSARAVSASVAHSAKTASTAITSLKSHVNVSAAAALTVPPTCGGQTSLVSDGSVWTCSFDTEFTGTTLPSDWVPITTATSGYVSGLTACFVSSPNNISVGNGYLSLTARREAAPFYCNALSTGFTTQYTSGTVSTYGLFSQTYGRFEVRAKGPASTIAGLQSSFWLNPLHQTYGAWPNSGEIDIAETYSDYPGLAIPYLHYTPFLGLEISTLDINTATSDSCTITAGAFNTYDVEWTPSTMTFIYNGKTCLVDRWWPMFPEFAPEPFNQPFFINLTQALGISPNTFNPATTQLPATTEVQYVRAWSYAG